MLTGIYDMTDGCQRSVEQKLTRTWRNHPDSYPKGTQGTVTVVSEKSAIQNIMKEVKKMKVKRLLAVLCVLVVLVTIFAIAASAYTGTACTACKKSTNLGTYMGPNPTWVTTSSYNCMHGTSGQDQRQQYSGQIHCFDCGNEFDGTIYRVLCRSTGNVYNVPDEVM